MSIHFTLLKERVTPVRFSYQSEPWGGYVEEKNPDSPLWARILPRKSPEKPSMMKATHGVDLRPNGYEVTIRNKPQTETITGFLWKNMLLRVVKDPALSSCKRFMHFETVGRKRKD